MNGSFSFSSFGLGLILLALSVCLTSGKCLAGPGGYSVGRGLSSPEMVYSDYIRKQKEQQQKYEDDLRKHQEDQRWSKRQADWDIPEPTVAAEAKTGKKSGKNVKSEKARKAQEAKEAKKGKKGQKLDASSSKGKKKKGKLEEPEENLEEEVPKGPPPDGIQKF